MAFIYAERVKEQTSTLGTGPLTLTGAVTAFRTFNDGIGVSNETYYSIILDAGATWEVGIGTLTAITTFSRDTVLASSNAGLPVNFAAGTKTIVASVAAEFFSAVLLSTDHASINHSGIPGVPPPESFTSGIHDLVDHTLPPFDLLSALAHQSVNHLAPPLNLLDQPTHNLIDHTGLTGVNSFSSAVHDATDHTGLPGVPFNSQATLLSADLGSGSGLGTGFTVDFVFGFSPIVFAVPFLATTTDGANDDLARITAIALNTPSSGTVRLTFDRNGVGTYDAILHLGCSAFGG